MECPECRLDVSDDSNYCRGCGHHFAKPEKTTEGCPVTESERKHVTVLFSDITGYTVMCEKMDPEEVREFTSHIFREISSIVAEYDGFIEKYAGDAVMVIFGVPNAHEDDPIRAIRVACKVHQLVEEASPKVEKKIGQPISMHTGVNTGLVVTGEVDMVRGTHGVTGDAVNLAARLSALARPGEILVASDTFRHADRYFRFETLDPIKVKGKAEPVQVYKYLHVKEDPVTAHRLSGLKAALIGRASEMNQLAKAVARLKEGKRTVFAICGHAGTGKSRLVNEFKSSFDPRAIQWWEGHSYPYTQNVPYFPFVDLMNRAFGIEEGDPPGKIRKTIQKKIDDLTDTPEDIVPYIAGLYSLDDPELTGISPELWKVHLQRAIRKLLLSVARKGPTVIFLEDLHWADPSSIELTHFLLSDFEHPVVFIFAFRPAFILAGHAHHEIRLQDLSPAEAEDMVASLLKSSSIPPELIRFVQEKVEGNPFYLEEMINALIESNALVRQNGDWRLVKQITESDIPSTIHGLLSARFDRLGRRMKRVLQEASVIGRAFLYEILKKISEFSDQCDQYLYDLERLDLIRTRSLQPDLEYIFKHALTQEVVYNGLLKKERRVLHEKIALMIERLFQDRLSEFYESLAFHYKRGHSTNKAVHYLMKSGEKSLSRYALEEAHQYYKDAFALLTQKAEKAETDQQRIIDLITMWAMVFHHRGDFKGMEQLFRSHESAAVSLGDDSRLGEYYMWLGQALHLRLKTRESYHYLTKAYRLGKKGGNERVMGWASAYLPSVCGFLGYTDDGLYYEKKALEIAGRLDSEPFLFIQSMASIGYASWSRGDRKKASEVGGALLAFGRRKGNIRALAIGNLNIGHSHLISGDYPAAIGSYRRAIDVAEDPFHTKLSETMLGICYLASGMFDKAYGIFPAVISFSREYGTETMGIPVGMFLGVVYISLGRISRGFKMIESAKKYFHDHDLLYFQAFAEYCLGKVYHQIAARSVKLDLSTMARNLYALARHTPFAYKKGRRHLEKAVQIGRETGAEGMVGEALLSLGLLHQLKGKPALARMHLERAAVIFRRLEAGPFLSQAETALASL